MNYKIFKISFLIYFFPTLLIGQSLTETKKFHVAGKSQYDDDLLSKEFHKKRRDALRAIMPDSSIAVFFSNPIRNRSNDINFDFHQDPNFYYLTGLNEPNSLLIMFKENQEYDSIIDNELIFIQDKDPRKEVWDGRRKGKNGVKETLGFSSVFLNSQFPDFNIDFSDFKHLLFVPLLDDIRDNKEDRGDLFSLYKHFKIKMEAITAKVNDKPLKELMAALREVKQPEELSLMRKAISMTCNAEIELMRALEPGMTEYQSQAIVEYFFKKLGSEHTGFPSILGGGENSCILHYSTNRKKLNNPELLVVDIGAEYHGYTADVTRTIPVKGKYSLEQKLIYNIVLDAQDAGIAACRAGNRFWEPNVKATEIIQKRLQELGILKRPGDVNKFFIHGTSHYLGLDVHDAGLFGNLTPGNVITVEPGIYIPEGSDCDPKWWNIGIRIEDDILVTDSDPEILSGIAPRSVEDIEKLMSEKSVFND